MENMHLKEGDIIHLRSASILKGSYVKLQPQTSDFISISNPKAVLEKSLGSFSALTKGETFRILYNKKKYDIGVVDVLPEGGVFPPTSPEAVCIIEADVQVDFEAPADYIEPKRSSQPSGSTLSSSPLTKSPLSGPALGDPKLDNDSSDDELKEAPTFAGSGFRLDGKPIKASKQPASFSHPKAVLQNGTSTSDVKLGVRIGSDGLLVSVSGPVIGAQSKLGVFGRTLSGATVPLPDVSAGQLDAGGAELDAGVRRLSAPVRCRPPWQGEIPSLHPSAIDGQTGNGETMGDTKSKPEDAVKRLGKAAEAPRRDAEYWNTLGVGKKMRD